ncbi:Dcp1p-Dcp2p decapping enzyme complex alpha subunit [Fusarium falciforme]|nr:Dcp1p-Dcp2p decapping enzyme complex alpha subunit [Fusarium falciforme]KAJ4206206.1 Dcp1p-Dcp2p decapping enzyme complex alpha subunit [Fusarium falciforme]
MNQQDGPITSIAEPGIKANFEMRKELRSKVSALLERNSMSFPGAQPVSFARQHLDELTRQEYASNSKAGPRRASRRLLTQWHLVTTSAKSRTASDISSIHISITTTKRRTT